MEKEKREFQLQSTTKRLMKLLTIALCSFVVLTIILMLLGPSMENIFVTQETIHISSEPGTVEATDKEFVSSGYVWIPGLRDREDSLTVFDMRIETFLHREIWATVDFAYLEINGRPAPEVLNLQTGHSLSAEDEGEEGAVYEFAYNLDSIEQQVIEVRVLEGFTDMTGAKIQMRFWYSAFSPCLCLPSM